MARVLICTLYYAVVSSGNEAPDDDLFKNVLSACSSLESIDDLENIKWEDVRNAQIWDARNIFQRE